jgi:hypothetical protein
VTSRRQKALRLGIVAALLGGLAASAAPSVAADLPPYPGSLPDTPSAVDVSGRGDYSGLKIHVNQTDDLTTQAVSVTWNWPGRSTVVGDNFYGQAYDANVLRIMQCWGDPVTSEGSDAFTAANFVEANQGPAREHCVYGASLNPLTGIATGNQYTRTASSYTTRPTAFGQETAYQKETGYNSLDIPFIAANGTVVKHQTEKDDQGRPVYANEFYDKFSSNEAPANYTFGPDGRGGVQFQVQNSIDARGLGCGAFKKDSTTEYNKCWLAIVPQGDTDFNGSPLKPPRSSYYNPSANQSPLASTNWSNRIVIPLNFLPSTTACASAGDTYSTLGSPLVGNALLSWQAKLCGSTGTVFNFAQGTDARSRDALAAGTTSMQFVSNPATSPTTPVTYAPVTLSGVGLAFVWDKALHNDASGEDTPGQPLPSINLNQRLVAKLLTYSYQQGNPARIGTNGVDREPGPDSYTWLTKNPAWLGSDPEFLALNPTLKDLGTGNVLLAVSPAIGFVQGPLDSSDAIARLWKWIVSDQDARDFLAGKADPYGMTVDPWYSTDSAKNPSGAPFDPNIDGFPYADPWQGIPGSTTKLCDEQTPLAMSDMRPAARDISTVAKDILTMNNLERYTAFQCPAGATFDNPVGWKTTRPGVIAAGQRQLMGFTDTASGAQFGTTFASLKNAAGKFVAPTTTSITAAGDHLAQTGVQGVQQPDLTTTDPAAYPLSLLGYAGVTTVGTPAAACSAYAELLNYAAADGQTAGTSIGDLPPGYVPLSATLRAQTAAAAKTVATCSQTVPTDNPDDPPSDNGTGDGGSSDTPVDDPGSVDNPSDGSGVGSDGGTTGPGTTTTPPGNKDVSLAATSRTKPDPNVFAYVVPIALGVGLLALLTAPLSGLRRRRSGGS